MTIDIRTLTLTVGLAILLQFVALLVQYRVYRAEPGLGWWTAGQGTIALAFAVSSLRDVSPLGAIAPAVNTVCLVAGMELLYVGVLRFQGWPVRPGRLVAFGAAFAIGLCHFSLVDDDLTARRTLLSTAVAVLALLIAWALVRPGRRPTTLALRFLAVDFAVLGLFFAVRALTAFRTALHASFFTPSPTQVSTYLVVLGATTLWTFGFIIAVNERLDRRGREARERLEESSRTVGLLLQSTDQGIYGIDVEGRCTFINASALRTLGYAPEECPGRDMHELIHHRRPDGSPYPVEECPIFQAKTTGVGRRVDGEVFWCKDGTSFPAEYSSFPVKDGDEIRGAVVTFSDITERKRLEETLRRQASTDELTGAVNRRWFLEVAETEVRRVLRYRRPLSIAVIDLDRFKAVNDGFGHAAGDRALQSVARIFQGGIRAMDVFARFGGDEFVLMLPETGGEEALAIVTRLCRAVKAQPLDVGGREVGLTLSAGVASVSAEADSLDALLERADRALYRAKASGRDRVLS